MHKTKLFNKSLTLFVHDEIYLSLKNGDFTKNRVYVGGEYRLFKWIAPQLIYIFQQNKEIKARAIYL